MAIVKDVNIIRWWWGTDALTLVKYPPGEFKWHVRIFFRRIFYKLFWKKFDEHWVVADHLKEYLIQFGIEEEKIKIKPVPIHYQKIEKKPHEDFNILYYCPNIMKYEHYHEKVKNWKFKSWLYGYDIYQKVKEYFGDQVVWHVVDGTADLSNVYTYIDFLLRPNRHDGYPAMVRECILNNIPYYWSRYGNPEFGFIIWKIKDEIKRKSESIGHHNSL